MVTITESKLKELQACVAALSDQVRTLDDKFRALVHEGGMEPSAPDRWKVIERGHVVRLAEEEVEELCESSPADLILHGPAMKLRYTRRDRQGVEVLRGWAPITLPQYKILFAGLCEPGPGHLFGNRTITRISHHEVSPRSLSSYMVDLTKSIQGGNTKGPYVFRTFWAGDESDTGWGYKFDARWHYVVIPQR